MEGKVKNNLHKESIIDFAAIFNKNKRYWWLFAASMVLCVSAALLYLYVKKPVYLINSTVLVSQDENASGMGSSLVKNLSMGMGGSNVDDEVLVMRSHDLRAQMVKELKTNRTYIEKLGFLKTKDCYNDSPVEVDAPDQLFDTLQTVLKFKIEVNDKGNDIRVKVKKGMFRTLADVKATSFPVTVKTDYGVYVVNKTKFYKPGEELELKAIVEGYVTKAENYDEKVCADLQSKKSNGIVLNMEESNVKRGVDILNKLAELYNKRGQLEKDEMALNTAKFIDERLSLIYNELSTSEAEIEQYKRNNNLSDMSAEVESLYKKRESSDVNNVKLETEYSIIKMINDFISDSRNNNAMVPFNADFSSAASAISGYNALVLERMKIENSAKGNNVVLKAMDDQLTALRANMRKSVEKSLESLSIQIRELKIQESLAKNKLGEIPTKEREARELYRQQAIKNELYTFLLQKREENSLVLAATTPKGKIVDRAHAFSEPIAPNKGSVAMLAIVLGLFIPVMILYIKALLTTKFSTQEELESVIAVPVVGEVCHNRHRSSMVVKEGKTSSIVELFRLLRSNVQFMLTNKDKVILVTSSVSGEGKSFVSLNLASSFALLGKKVALVGLDIRKPKLADYLGLKNAPGVTNYMIKDDIKLDSIVQNLTEGQMDVYVSGPIPPNPSELLLSNRVEELINELREKYDYVVVDSAPIAMVSDSFSLARYVDMVLFVTRANYTKRSFVKYFNSTIAKGQFKNAAAVLNDSNPKLSQGYGYGYGNKEE